MSSSWEREAGFQAKIRKLRKELKKTDCMRKEELERREKKQGDQRGASRTCGRYESWGTKQQAPRRRVTVRTKAMKNWERREMRVKVEGRRKGGRQCVSEVEKKVGRRMRARETSKDMTDEMD